MMISRLHRQQTRSKLNICLSTTKAGQIFNIQDSKIICDIDNLNSHIIGFLVHYGHLTKGGGLKMSQDRRKDFDSVLNDIAILLGIISDSDQRYEYMRWYDGHTRAAESAALQAGEHYNGKFQLVTYETKYVSYLMI